jgi:hypothetical protein
VVRVSGEGSVDYSGEDGTCEGDLQLVEDALRGEPAEYEVAEVVSDGVTAFFRRTQSDGGELSPYPETVTLEKMSWAQASWTNAK